MKKLTISIDDQVYADLQRVIGAGRIARFLNDLAKPELLRREQEAARIAEVRRQIAESGAANGRGDGVE